MCDWFFISFTSDDHKTIFPNINGSAFVFKLDRELHFIKGEWEVTLISFYNEALKREYSFIICLDGVIQSVTGENRLLPCLDRYPKFLCINNQQLSFQLARGYIYKLHVYIHADESLLKLCQKKTSTVQLLFRRVKCIS